MQALYVYSSIIYVFLGATENQLVLLERTKSYFKMCKC